MSETETKTELKARNLRVGTTVHQGMISQDELVAACKQKPIRGADQTRALPNCWRCARWVRNKAREEEERANEKFFTEANAT